MISNFDEVKRQLSELSEVINKFKSEAVQLRIVEIVLGEATVDRNLDEEAEIEDTVLTKPKRRKRKAARTTSKKAGATDTQPTATKARSRGHGAGSVLTQLIESGFFSKPRTIGEIVSHSEEKLAHKFKSSAFSPVLARSTRAGILSRSKNGDGQYEYTKA